MPHLVCESVADSLTQRELFTDSHDVRPGDSTHYRNDRPSRSDPKLGVSVVVTQLR